MPDVGPVSSLTARTVATLADADSLYIDDGAGGDRRVTWSTIKAALAVATLAAGVLTASAPMVHSQTWNEGSTTFVGRSTDITDTASAAASLIERWRVGGSVVASIDKAGALVASSINKVAITAPASSATLTIANGKTLTVSNTLTLTGTDASSVAFGAGGTVLYTAGGTLVGHLLFTDNTYDIGASGATRPRIAYLGTGLNSPLWTAANTATINSVGDGLIKLQYNAGNGAVLQFGGLSKIQSPGDGVLLVQDSTGGGFNRLLFGSTSSSYPALKRSTTNLEVKLADDSAYTYIQAQAFVPNPLATGSLPAAPPEGSIVYDTTLNKLKLWNGAAYETITSV